MNVRQRCSRILGWHHLRGWQQSQVVELALNYEDWTYLTKLITQLGTGEIKKVSLPGPRDWAHSWRCPRCRDGKLRQGNAFYWCDTCGYRVEGM